MKNSTAPNRKTGRMIAKNLIVLFTVALAGFCGIQAWFTDKRSAEANGIAVECQAPDGIEIAVVGHGALLLPMINIQWVILRLIKLIANFLRNFS